MSVEGVPRGRQGEVLAAELRRRITDGTLACGVHLPSSRRLAADLGVSRGVVVAVYEQLTAEGHLSSAPGSGTSVAERSTAITARSAPG
ncbi:MAG: winged helix-turn-helix domain-containing protein [Ilumatobacteraceae bacterium]